MSDSTTIDPPVDGQEQAADTNVVTLRPRTDSDASEPAESAAHADEASADGDEASAADAQVAELRPIVRGTAEPIGPALEHQLEALLFVSPTPLTTEQLAEYTDEDPDDLQDCLVDMMQAWSNGHRGIVLERVAGGWAFRAADTCEDILRRMTRPQGDTKLSPSAIETLAIVAYLQPVSRPDLAKIRGVSVDAAMTGLMERGFIEEAGRSDTGAVLFRTTAHFERAFGLSSLGALPELDGFGPGDEEVARMKEQLEKMAEARVE
ncbi:MAG: SMC-Scp complex subunit ScpB [Thermoleophilia bacterium]|nr:SMC-Scp complex subunit ScpB [Thermoleophilia bacterium]